MSDLCRFLIVALLRVETVDKEYDQDYSGSPTQLLLEASESGNLSRPRPAQPSSHVVAALRDVLQLLLDGLLEQERDQD